MPTTLGGTSPMLGQLSVSTGTRLDSSSIANSVSEFKKGPVQFLEDGRANMCRRWKGIDASKMVQFRKKLEGIKGLEPGRGDEQVRGIIQSQPGGIESS
ncbi:MAG: hypothetical protein JEZ06_00240 [Anaerolineaceae bacterium]|nr:hypothetical protein [Anaerolineaceae bacterium]